MLHHVSVDEEGGNVNFGAVGGFICACIFRRLGGGIIDRASVVRESI